MSIIITINAKGTLHELFTINLQKNRNKSTRLSFRFSDINISIAPELVHKLCNI